MRAKRALYLLVKACCRMLMTPYFDKIAHNQRTEGQIAIRQHFNLSFPFSYVTSFKEQNLQNKLHD